MKTFIFMSLSLFFSHSAFATVNCDATVSYYQRVDNSLVAKLVRLPTTTSPATPNTTSSIIAERMFGTELSIRIKGDESSVTDTTNYINKLSNGKNIYVGSETKLPWDADNTVTIVHKSSEGWIENEPISESEEILAATFTLRCQRTL